MNTTSTKTATRLLAALTMAAGLGTAIVTGSAVASADDTQTKIYEITQEVTEQKAVLCDAKCQQMRDYIRA